MLDVALIELVSAGLRRFFVHKQTDTTLSADGEPGRLVRRLLVDSPEAARALIDRCVTDQWHCIQANQLPTPIATAHLALLPAILASDQTAPKSGSDFFSQPPPALADTIILAHGVETHDVDAIDGSIDDTILTVLLETFLESLHACRAEIEALAPLLVETPRPAAESKSPPADTVAHTPPKLKPEALLTIEKIARADTLSISVPLLELITVAIINRTRSPHLRQADLADAAAEARSIRTELVALTQRGLFGWSRLDTLITTFDAGRFDACNRMLTAIEEEAVRQGSTRTPRISELVECAISMRLLRARLYALQGADVAAARQLGNAQRHLSRADHIRRWHFANREARHYERAACHDRSSDHLDSAARVCSSALASLNDDTAPTLRAEAQSELAHYLIRLGHFEQLSSRFEIAAQLLEDAVPGLNSDERPRLKLLALIRHGDALRELSRLTGAGHLADRAVASYEAASKLIPAVEAEAPTAELDKRPFDESVVALRARLALALASRVGEGVDRGLRETALETIIEVLPDLTGPHDIAVDAQFSSGWLAGLSHYAVATWLTSVGETSAARQHSQAAARCLEEIGCTALNRQLAAETRNAPNAPAPLDPGASQAPHSTTAA